MAATLSAYVVDLPGMSKDWERIATDLAEALESFMAYDGYGLGGADDGNRGNWRGADRAIAAYRDKKDADT